MFGDSFGFESVPGIVPNSPPQNNGGTGSIIQSIIQAGSGITQSIINSQALSNLYKYAPNAYAVPNLSLNPQTGALAVTSNNSSVILFGLLAVVVLVLLLRK